MLASVHWKTALYVHLVEMCGIDGKSKMHALAMGNTALQRTCKEHAPASVATKVSVPRSKESWQDIATSSWTRGVKLRRIGHAKLGP